MNHNNISKNTPAKDREIYGRVPFLYSSLKDKATFVCIRKNASSSIGHAIFKYNNGYWYDGEINEYGIYTPSRDIPNNLNTYKFTCIRDPFERIVSAFLHKVIVNPGIAAEEYFISNPYHNKFLNDIPAYFNNFIEYIENTGVINTDIHFNLQSKAIRYGEVSYNKILRFENIIKDWEDVKKDIDGLPDLPKQKVNSTSSYKYYDILRPIFLSRVQEIYKKDYDMHNNFSL